MLLTACILDSAVPVASTFALSFIYVIHVHKNAAMASVTQFGVSPMYIASHRYVCPAVLAHQHRATYDESSDANPYMLASHDAREFARR